MTVQNLIERLLDFPPDMDVAFVGEDSDNDVYHLPYYSVMIIREQKVIDLDNARNPYEYIDARGGSIDYPEKQIKTIIALG